MTEQVLLTAITIAFGAGGALFLIRQVRKDVNGLGRMVRDDAKKSEERFGRLEKALLLVSKNDPERRKIAEYLDSRRDS